MKFAKIAALSGVLAPAVALIFLGAALSQAPWFSWTENCLSDLGGEPGGAPIWSSLGPPSILFNAGLIISGLLGLALIIWMLREEVVGPKLTYFGFFILLLDTLALIAIGALPETVGVIHFFVSAAFFTLAPISMLIIGASLLRSDRRMGIFVVLLGITGVYAITIPLVEVSCAVNEVLSVAPFMLFVLAFGLRMLRSLRKRPA